MSMVILCYFGGPRIYWDQKNIFYFCYRQCFVNQSQKEGKILKKEKCMDGDMVFMLHHTFSLFFSAVTDLQNIKTHPKLVRKNFICHHYCRPSRTEDICITLNCPHFYGFWYHRSYMVIFLGLLILPSLHWRSLLAYLYGSLSSFR